MTFSLKAKNPVPRRIAAGLSVIILAACGGGGGGGGGGGSPPPVAVASVKYALSGGIVSPVPEGVVLQDGLGNTVPLAVGDTAFKFNAGQSYLTAGATYNVTVKTQPAGYTCSTERNTGSVSGDVAGVELRCSGLLAKQNLVSYIGRRDGTFGFQEFAMYADGDAFVTVSSELWRVDTTGKMHSPTLLDMSTGIPMTDLTVQNVAIGASGIMYLGVQRNANETTILRVRRTFTENVYMVETLAQSFVDASGQRRNLGFISGMSVDSADNLYIADKTASVIRRISATGVVTTFVGSGSAATIDGTGTAAALLFRDPVVSMSHDGNNNLYVEGDYDKNLIRKITPAGVVTSITVPAGYRNMVADKTGNLYFVSMTSNGIPSITRIGATGVADLLVSRGAVNLDTAPNNLRANAIGYIRAIKVMDGYIYVAGHNPMAIYKIKM